MVQANEGGLMKIYIMDEKSELLRHDPNVFNCTCGNQINLEVGDVVRVMPFANKLPDGTRPRDHLSFEEPRMFQIICPVCFTGITWERQSPNMSQTASA